MKFKLAYYDPAVQRFNHYTTRTRPLKSTWIEQSFGWVLDTLSPKKILLVCMQKNVCVCVCIYIYIYIYSHPQTDCFIVSQPFIVTTCVWCFMLGLKPIWLYISWKSYPRAIITLSISGGSFYIYLFTYILTANRSAQSRRRAIAFLCMWQTWYKKSKYTQHIHIMIRKYVNAEIWVILKYTLI